MMAAPYEGPVAAQEAAPPPAAMGAPADGASEGARPTNGHDAAAPEPDKDEDDDGGAWDAASLYEEILDEVEAFEYSANGESGVMCAPLRSN